MNAETASYTAILAQAGIPDSLRKQTQSKLRKANDRRDNLTECEQARTSAAAFRGNVDAEQVVDQEQVLTNAQTRVATHKDTLSS